MGSAAAALLCTVSLAVTALPTGAWAASTAQTTDYLNLRTGAGQSYSVLLTMPKGTEVTILDDSQGEWAKVRLASGQEGYCSKEYLTAVGSLSTATYGALATGDTAVTTANLNVRKGVGTSYGIVTTLAEGASVTILDSSHATWAHSQRVGRVLPERVFERFGRNGRFLILYRFGYFHRHDGGHPGLSQSAHRSRDQL